MNTLRLDNEQLQVELFFCFTLLCSLKIPARYSLNLSNGKVKTDPPLPCFPAPYAGFLFFIPIFTPVGSFLYFYFVLIGRRLRSVSLFGFARMNRNALGDVTCYLTQTIFSFDDNDAWIDELTS